MAKDYYMETYGISTERVDEMILEQKGRCYVCEREFSSEPGMRANLDHNHTTGMIRRVICTTCNHFIGRIEATPGFLQKAVNYIRHHREIDKEKTGVYMPLHLMKKSSKSVEERVALRRERTARLIKQRNR